MELAEAWMIGTLIVKDHSRLGRNRLVVGQLLEEEFDRLGVRYIAILDNIDTAQGLSDFLPVQDWFNEMHAKNTSQKVREVFKHKGESGIPLATKPPYGYMKNPENPKEWIIDEPAAEVVRRIFELCIKGYGPTQIADILTNDKVPTPTEYWISQGLKAGNPPAIPGRWVQTCVADMLERQEYVGDTVNFRSTRKSFKNKAKVIRPEEEWMIFENTHPAIIDRETFAIVKELRNNKCRPTREGKVSIFSGLLFCKDCGSKMYFCTAKNFKKEQNWFTCAKARKNKEQCTAHFIREVYLEKAVLESMRRVFWFARCYEDLFVKQLQEKSVQEAKKELARKKRELEKTEKRIAELDKDKEQNDGIEKFITKVKAITDIQELTPEIVREFISRIDVYAPYRENNQRHQRIDIYYHGVGYVFIPETEEVEEMFQEHLRDRKDNIKVKTA